MHIVVVFFFAYCGPDFRNARILRPHAAEYAANAQRRQRTERIEQAREQDYDQDRGKKKKKKGRQTNALNSLQLNTAVKEENAVDRDIIYFTPLCLCDLWEIH